MMDSAASGVARLNAMPVTELAECLRACCGSSRWVTRMIARRPFPAPEAVLSAADDVCRTLTRDDWLEAFAHHPRLGEAMARTPAGERAAGWSLGEQAALATAGVDVRTALAAANEAYEREFGYICIVCPSGKDSEELLAVTRARLGNKAAIELKIAAEEQRKITHLRLNKLFRDAPIA